MPIYFSQVAPTCPISRDQPTANSPRIRVRANIPKATDLQSAINTANIARSIVSSYVFDRVRNNVFKADNSSSNNKQIISRWVEDTRKRVKGKYKYYVEDEFTGEFHTDAWIQTERIEQMVWVDRGWGVNMVWQYGDKGEGWPEGTVPIKVASEAVAGGDESTGSDPVVPDEGSGSGDSGGGGGDG